MSPPADEEASLMSPPTNEDAASNKPSTNKEGLPHKSSSQCISDLQALQLIKKQPLTSPPADEEGIFNESSKC